MAVANPTWIREYMKNKGFQDSQIGYDNKRKMVTANGQDFFQADYDKGGKAYGDVSTLDKAYNTYQQNQKKPVTTAAVTPTTVSQPAQPDPWQTKVNALYDRLDAAANKPFEAYKAPAQFQYDPENDPQYQAALNRAKANAATATNNAMVSLGERGIGNSSIVADRANQIQQGELGRVSDTVLPQLMDQAYRRYVDDNNKQYQQYMDQYGMYRDSLGDVQNLLSTANNLGQQDIANEYQKWQQRQDEKKSNLDAALRVGDQTGKVIKPTDDWGGLFRQGNAPLNLQGQQVSDQKAQQQWENAFNQGQFDWQKAQQAWENKFKEKNFEQQVKEFSQQMGLNWSKMNQDQKQFAAQMAFRQKEFDYNKGRDAIRDNNKTAGAGSYKQSPDFASDMQYVMNNENAYDQLKANADQFIQKYGVDGFNDLLKAAGGE